MQVAKKNYHKVRNMRTILMLQGHIAHNQTAFTIESLSRKEFESILLSDNIRINDQLTHMQDKRDMSVFIFLFLLELNGMSWLQIKQRIQHSLIDVNFLTSI